MGVNAFPLIRDQIQQMLDIEGPLIDGEVLVWNQSLMKFESNGVVLLDSENIFVNKNTFQYDDLQDTHTEAVSLINSTPADSGVQSQNSPFILQQGSVFIDPDVVTFKSRSGIVADPINGGAYLIEIDPGSGTFFDALKVGIGGNILSDAVFNAGFTANDGLFNASLTVSGHLQADSLTVNNLTQFAAGSPSRPSMNIPDGDAPNSPNIGDIWFDSSRIYYYDGFGNRSIANANDLSGYALDANVVHLSGFETITGDKEFQGITQVNNILVTGGDWNGSSITDTYISSASVWNAKQDALGYTPENIANKDAANGYAGLDSSGLINPSQLPALAITDTFVVGSQAAMLALTAEVGDIAVRFDLNKTYILKTTGASTLSHWQELLTPTDSVTSVFGRSGAVTAQSGDYSFAQIVSTPTTLSGYGITDAQPLNSNLTTYAGIAPSSNVQTLLGAANYAAFKTSLSLNNVENTALSTWAGSTSITTLGTIATGSIPESLITFTDILTGNVSTTKHGFTPKLPNDATKFLDGTGSYSVPPSGPTINGTNGVIPYRSSSTVFSDSPLSVASGRLVNTPTLISSGVTSYYQIITPVDTNLTTAVESIGIQFGGSSSAATVIRQHATGAIATQREVVFIAPTYSFAGASTITNAATVAINAAPIAGSNATITNSWAFWVQAGKAQFSGGISAPGAGGSSEAFGIGAAATGTRDVALGQSATAQGGDSVAIGALTTVNGGNSGAIVIGSQSGITGSSGGAIVIGKVAGTGTGNATGANSISIGIGSCALTANSMVVGASAQPINIFYGGKGESNATPTTFTLSGTNGLGTDIAGGNIQVSAGKGTGTGVPGTVVVTFARPSTTSSTVNTTSDSLNFTYSTNSVNILFKLKSSTTAEQDAAQISGVWADATHATRTGYLAFSTILNGTSKSVHRMRCLSDQNVGDIAVMELPTGTLAGFSFYTQTTSPSNYYFSGLRENVSTFTTNSPGIRFTIIHADAGLHTATITTTKRNTFVMPQLIVKPAAESGTDVAGVDMIVGAGAGTGTGASGNIKLQFARPSTTSATANTLDDQIIFQYSTDALKQTWQLKSSTTALQDATQISGLWTTNTHASRTSAITFSLVNNAGALTEYYRMTPGAFITPDGTLAAPSHSFSSNTALGMYRFGNNNLGIAATAVTLATNGATISWDGASTLTSVSDGTFLMRNSGGTGFSMLQLGGTNASHPGLKDNGTELQIRLADDSLYASVGCRSIKTNDPTSGQGPAWKLGAKKSATVALVTTDYVEIDIAGVMYKLGLVT